MVGTEHGCGCSFTSSKSYPPQNNRNGRLEASISGASLAGPSLPSLDKAAAATSEMCVVAYDDEQQTRGGPLLPVARVTGLGHGRGTMAATAGKDLGSGGVKAWHAFFVLLVFIACSLRVSHSFTLVV